MGGRFTKINDSFNCESCGRLVPTSQKTCRNHCPFCLTSKHVDIMPGDRSNPCQGLMAAVDYDLTGHKGLVLIFRCTQCGELTRNIALTDDVHAPDDYDLILALKQKTQSSKR